MVRASMSSESDGSNRVEPGLYHGVINACEVCSYEEEKTDRKTKAVTKVTHYGIQLEVEILAGSVPDQVGKVMQFQNFYHKRLFKIAAAINLTDRVSGQPFTRQKLDKMEADIAAGVAVADTDFDETEASGRQFRFNVEMGKPKKSGKYIGQSFPQIGDRILGVLDPEGNDIPVDQAMVNLVIGDAAEPVNAAPADPMFR